MIDTQLLEEMGLASLPPDKQEEALLNIGRIVYQGILLRVMEILSDEEKKEFEALLAQKPEVEDRILKFLQVKIPDLDGLVEEEIARFKEESASILRGAAGE